MLQCFVYWNARYRGSTGLARRRVCRWSRPGTGACGGLGPARCVGSRPHPTWADGWVTRQASKRNPAWWLPVVFIHSFTQSPPHAVDATRLPFLLHACGAARSCSEPVVWVGGIAASSIIIHPFTVLQPWPHLITNNPSFIHSPCYNHGLT